MSSATISVKDSEDGRLPAGQCETELKVKVEQAGAACLDKAKDMASSVMEQASSMAHAVGDAGAAVGEKANDATAAVGSRMNSVAGTIRETMPREGVLGTASSSVAGSLESGGRYLQEKNIGGMAEDITNLIRRNPVPALLVGVGIGFVLAKVAVWGFGNGK
jgi:hypothetical protein